jgi:hypothetical protein
MANKQYVNNAIVVYDDATGTQRPGIGLSLDGLDQSSAVPQTVFIPPVTVSGLYLATLYMRIKTPASGDGTPSSTIGPVTVYFTCADCLVPVILTAGLLLQNGTVAPTNSENSQSVSLSGSVLVNALAGTPISVAIGYASSGATPTATSTCTLTSAAWNVAGIEVRGTPVYVGGNVVSQSCGAVTETVTYSPTAGNAAVLYFSTGSAITGLVVKDNLGHTLSAGPTSGLLASFYQYPVPAGVTSYTATWTTARQSSFVVEEYSGVTAVNAALSGNTASGSSNTATLTVTDDEGGDFTVFGFTSPNILTATVGNQRHQVNGSTARLTVTDNSAAVAMVYNYHLKAVFIGGTH